MNRDDMSFEENDLAERLHREAEAYGPEYSPALHRRLMAGLSSAPGTAALPHTRHYWPWAVGAAVAAMVVLTAWIVWPKPAPPRIAVAPPPMVTPQLPTLDPMLDQLEASRFAYLDRDAMDLVHFVEGQIDVPQARR